MFSHKRSDSQTSTGKVLQESVEDEYYKIKNQVRNKERNQQRKERNPEKERTTTNSPNFI
jgi:hypothetical protein